MSLSLLVYNGPSVPADTAAAANSVAQRDSSGNLTNNVGIGSAGLVSGGYTSLKCSATKTAAFTIDLTATVWPCDATAAAFAVTLPPAATVPNLIYVVKKIDSSANAVTLTGNGTETIDGANTKALSAQWAAYVVQSNGTSWNIIGKV